MRLSDLEPFGYGAAKFFLDPRLLWRLAQGPIDPDRLQAVADGLDAWRHEVPRDAIDEEKKREFLVDLGDEARRRMALAACSTIAAMAEFRANRRDRFARRVVEAALDFDLAMKRPRPPAAPTPLEDLEPFEALDGATAILGREDLPSLGLAMVRSALADLCPDERDRFLGLPGRSQKMKVILVHKTTGRGMFATLSLETFLDCKGPPAFFPDPLRLGARGLDGPFLSALDLAWSYAREKFGPGQSVRWSLEVPEPSSHLQGNSLGAAFAVGLSALADGTALINEACITAALVGVPVKEGAPLTRTGRQASGALEGVGDVPVKVLELPLLVLSKDDYDRQADDLRPRLREGTVLAFAPDVASALTLLSGRAGAVASFLDDLGRIGLNDEVKVRPDWTIRATSPHALAEFCIRPRVRTWGGAHRVTGRAAPDGEADLDDLASVLAKPNYRVVLWGETGEGKSTCIRLHAHALCRDQAEQIRRGELPISEVRVPLVLPLKKAETRDRSPRLLDQARKATANVVNVANVPSDVRSWFRAQVRQFRCHLLLDSLEDLRAGDASNPDDWLSHELIGLERKPMPILLTTRPRDDRRWILDGAERYRLAAFDADQVRNYIDGYYGGPEMPEEHRAHAARLHEHVRSSPNLREMLRYPLLLGRFCQLRPDNAGVAEAKSLGALLAWAVGMMMDWADRKWVRVQHPLRNEVKLGVLGRVAFRYYARGPLPIDAGGFLEVLRESLPDFDRFDARLRPSDEIALRRELLEDGLIVEEGPNYSFILRPFHKFCLAHWIAHHAPGARGPADEDAFGGTISGHARDWGRPEGWSRGDHWGALRPIDEEEWAEVWPLVASRLGGSDRARWVVGPCRRRWGDGGLLRVARMISELPGDHPLRVEFFAEMLDRIDRSIGSYRDRRVTLAAGRIANERSAGALRDRLADRAAPDRVRILSARALGVMGGESSARAVRDQLSAPDCPPDLRKTCAVVIDRIEPGAGVAFLEESLAPPSPGPSWEDDVEALWRIDGPGAIATLDRLLDRPGLSIARLADVARWMGLAVDPCGQDELARRLANPATTDRVRFACHCGLASSDPHSLSEVSRKLWGAFVDEETRIAAAWSLGWVRGEDAMKAKESLTRVADNPTTPATVARACRMALGLPEPRTSPDAPPPSSGRA